MKKYIAIALGVLLVLAAQNVALGQSPAGPTTTLKSTFSVADPPAQFQVVQQILDFPPGAWTPAHSHGGPAFVTIALGEVTQLSDGKETTYKVGDTWSETPGHTHQAGNATSAPARTLVTFLLPTGAQQTIPQQMANPHDSSIKTKAMVSKFDQPSVARPFDVVEMQLDFQPGQWLPTQAYGGPAYFTVMNGEMTSRANGSEKTAKAGENWTQSAGDFSQVGNGSTAPASVFVTVLLPKGANLATTQPSTSPETGGQWNGIPLGLALLAALAVVAGGLLWQRNATRAR